MSEDTTPTQVRPVRQSPLSRRRVLLYLSTICGISLAGWGVARFWDDRLHAPARQHYRTGQELYNSGQIEPALAEWQSATISAPWWPEPYFRLAQGLQEADQPEAAVLVLRKAASTVPNAEHLTCRLAEAYGLMEDRIGAEEWAAAAVKKEPQCARGHLLYARTHRGSLADTLKHYREAHRLSGNDAIQLELAKVQAQSGDLKAAEGTVGEYLARHPADLETHYLQGYILSRRARDPAGIRTAAGHLEAVLAEAPERYDAHAELGLLYERHRHWPKARHHFERARKLNPYSATILFHLATVLRQMRDPAATKLWDEVRMLQAKERRWREARRELLRAPNSIPLLLETAELSRDLGARRIATNLVQSALEQDPKNEKARQLLESLQPAAAPEGSP